MVIILFVLFSFCLSAQDNKIKLSIDHVNVAVNDLKKAEKFFTGIGFTVKPGRYHKNSIRNIHLKFSDGNEIEFITADEPLDDLAGKYISMKKEGDGGAFLAFRSSTFNSLLKKIYSKTYDVDTSSYGKIKFLDFKDNQPLESLWILDITQPWIDKPEILSHKNGALSLKAVWLNKKIEKDLKIFFKELGFNENKFFTLSGSDFEEIKLTDGSVYLTGKTSLLNNRSITGVTVEVKDISEAEKIMQKRKINFEKDNSRKSLIISPEYSFGIWFELIEKSE